MTEPESLLSDYQSLFTGGGNTDGAAYFPTCTDSSGNPCNAPVFDMKVREGTPVDELTGCPERCTINPGAFYSTLQEWEGDLISGKHNYENQIKRNDANIISVDKSRIKGHQIKSILRSQCGEPKFAIDINDEDASADTEINQLIDKIYTDTVTAAAYGKNSYPSAGPIDLDLKKDEYSSKPDILPFDISNDNWVKDYNNLYYPKPRPTPGSTVLEPPLPQIITDRKDPSGSPSPSVLGIPGPGGHLAEFDNGLYGRYQDKNKLCGINVGQCKNSKDDKKKPMLPNGLKRGQVPGNESCGLYFDNLVHNSTQYSDIQNQFTTRTQNMENIDYEQLCTIQPLPPDDPESDGRYNFAFEGRPGQPLTNCVYTPPNSRLPEEYIDLNLVDKCSIEHLEGKLFEEGGMTYAQINNLKDPGRNDTEAIGWIKNLKIIESGEKSGDRESPEDWKNDCTSGRRSPKECFRYGKYVQEGDTYEYECGPGMMRVGGVPKCEKASDERARLNVNRGVNYIFPEYLIEADSPSWNLNEFKCVPIENQGVCNDQCIKKEISVNCVASNEGAVDDVKNECRKRPKNECMKDTKCMIDNEITNKLCLSSGMFNEGDDCNYWTGSPLTYKLNFGLISLSVIALIIISWRDASSRLGDTAADAVAAVLNSRWLVAAVIAVAISFSTLFFRHDSLSNYQNIVSIIVSVVISFLIIIVAPSAATNNAVDIFIKLIIPLVAFGLYAFLYYLRESGIWPQDDTGWKDIAEFATWYVFPLITIIFTSIVTGFIAVGASKGRTPLLTLGYMLYIVFFIGYLLLSYIGFLNENQDEKMEFENLKLEKIGLNFDGYGNDSIIPTLMKFIALIVVVVLVIFSNPGEAKDGTTNDRIVGFIVICFVLAYAGFAFHKNITTEDGEGLGTTDDNNNELKLNKSYIRGFMIWLLLFFLIALISMQSFVIHNNHVSNIVKKILWFVMGLFTITTGIFIANLYRFLGIKIEFIDKNYIGFFETFVSKGTAVNENNLTLSATKDYIGLEYGKKLLWDEIVDIIDGQSKMDYTNARDIGNKATIVEIVLGFKYIIYKYGDKLNLPAQKCGLINVGSSNTFDVKKFTNTWNNKDEEINVGPTITPKEKSELLYAYGAELEDAKKIFEIVWNNIHDGKFSDGFANKNEAEKTKEIIQNINQVYAFGEQWSHIDDQTLDIDNNDSQLSGAYMKLRYSIPIIRFILKKWIDDNSKITIVDDLKIQEYCDYTGEKITNSKPCNKCFSNEKNDPIKSKCLNNEVPIIDGTNFYKDSNGMYGGIHTNADGENQINIYKIQSNYREIGGTPNLAKFSCEFGIDNIFSKTKTGSNDYSWSKNICHKEGEKIFADLIGVDGESCSTVMQYADLGENQECDINEYIACYNSESNINRREDLSGDAKRELLNDVCGNIDQNSVSYNFDGEKTISSGDLFTGEDIIGYEEKQFSSCCSLQVDGNEVPTPSDCLDPNMTYCRFNNPNMRNVYSGIDGVCMPSPSPGSNPCPGGINDNSDRNHAGGTDFISKWGGAFPDWLNIYRDDNTNTLRLRYCGEESAAPASMVPACNDSQSIASGKFNNLFSGPIDGDDFRRKCCTNVPSGSPPSPPAPSGSPPSPPAPSGSPVSPPGPSVGDALRACDTPYNVDMGNGPEDLPPFPCSPYDVFFRDNQGLSFLNTDIETACGNWNNAQPPDPPLPPADLTKWTNLKETAAQNCVGDDTKAALVRNIYDKIFNTVSAATEFNTAQDGLLGVIEAGGEGADSARAELNRMLSNREIPMNVYNTYIENSGNQDLRSNNNYIQFDGTYKDSGAKYVNANILVTTQFN